MRPTGPLARHVIGRSHFQGLGPRYEALAHTLLLSFTSLSTADTLVRVLSPWGYLLARCVQPPLCTSCPCSKPFPARPPARRSRPPLSVGPRPPFTPCKSSPGCRPPSPSQPRPIALRVYISTYSLLARSLLFKAPLYPVSGSTSPLTPPRWQKPHTDRNSRSRLNRPSPHPPDIPAPDRLSITHNTPTRRPTSFRLNSLPT